MASAVSDKSQLELGPNQSPIENRQDRLDNLMPGHYAFEKNSVKNMSNHTKIVVSSSDPVNTLDVCHQGCEYSSIQAAVDAANPGDTINVGEGTYTENLHIDKPLTIKGAGAGKTIVDGNQAGSVFAIGASSPNIDVTLSSITITHGSGTTEYGVTYGGGVLNFGGLTVEGCTISDNSAYYGGGIISFGTAIIKSSNIRGNSATWGGGIGQGIMGSVVAKTLSVSDSTISGNSATGGGAGINNYLGSATVMNCVISGNSANEIGGGINSGGAATVTVTVSGSTISNNQATNHGGGICNDGTIVIAGTTISSNTASLTGGGISNSGTASVTEDSLLTSNSAAYGGGIYTQGTGIVTGTTISSNTATQNGGGICTDGDATVTDSTISSNTAAYYGGGISNGGALSIGGTSQIINNQVTTGNGGGVLSGYVLSSSVTFDGTNVAIKSNKASLPSPSELSWYQGWGVYLNSGTPTTINGFDPATQVTDNNLITSSSPPNTPSTPTGPPTGSSGTAYTYSTSATDPEGDQVKYTFDWDDGTYLETEFQPSGTLASLSHTWTMEGTYEIRVMAIDTNGEKSGWSETKLLGVKPDAPEVLYIQITPSEMDTVPLLTEKEITFKATVRVPEGYEVILYAWLMRDLADPSKNIIVDSSTDTCKHKFSAGEYGKKEIRCLIKSRKIEDNDIVRALGSKEFNVFFPKYKERELLFIDWRMDADDNGNGIPNWFEYWKKNGAAPEINLVKHISEDQSVKRRKDLKESYGYSVPGDGIYISKAAEYHYPSSILLKNTYFGTEVFGGDLLSTGAYGIDCISEVIAHEEYHRGVDENWTNHIFEPPSSDTDFLPDDYEEGFSHTDVNNPDTYDLAVLKSSEYSTYGDQEYMAMRNGSGKEGFCGKDWAYPGCQKGSESLSYAVGSIARGLKSIELSTTNIAGNFEEHVLDENENGYFDYLIVGLDINISNGSYYYIEANLTDGDEKEITVSSNLLKLSVGISRVEIPLDGIQINHHAVNGPYKISFVLYDQEGNRIDSVKNALITAPYLYTQFEGQQGILKRTFSDVGVDSNGDRIFEALKIDVGIVTNAEGNFTVEGFLFDQENNSIASASASAHLLMGNSTVPLSFNGTEIAYSKRSGPYLLRYLKLIAGNDSEIDFKLDAYSTDYYETSDFLIQDARLKGEYTDLGTDEDGDGLFDYLQIDAGVNITTESDFILTGTLYNSTSKAIDLATNQVHLAPGEHIMSLKFDGRAIFRNGANETFSLQDIFVYKANDMTIQDFDMKSYTTANYSFLLFESGINKAPKRPMNISGPSSGFTNESYKFRTSATDPDGDQVKYTFDWGDGATSQTNLVDSGTVANATHIWNSSGIYQIRTKATDSKGASSEWSGLLNVTINTPPNTPAIPSGQASGIPGTSYSYSTSASDPDGDQVKYTFDWGDGTTSMTSLVNSSTIASASHTWNNTGIYLVKAKATDSNGLDSEWSNTISVSILNRPPNAPDTPIGVGVGFALAPYSYATSSIDPDGDQVKYTFDWGDGTTSVTSVTVPN
jgi:predicted outer membrane repeat protein